MAIIPGATIISAYRVIVTRAVTGLSIGDPIIIRNPSTCLRQFTMSRNNRLVSVYFFRSICVAKDV